MKVTATLSCVLIFSLVFAACTPTPKEFDPPGKTDWVPEGCRDVQATHPALPTREAWRTLHADGVNSDEVSTAAAPVFEHDWIGEPNMWVSNAGVFDAQGNECIVPHLNNEGLVLLSLDAADGSRRWAVSGTGLGFGAPLILNNPAVPGEEVVYRGLYDHAVAVKTDGTVVWDLPTGLTLPPDPKDQLTVGINYVPGIDALVTATRDGHLCMQDRASGVLLAQPHRLPGSPAPPPGLITSIPEAISQMLQDSITEEITALLGGSLPPGMDGELLVTYLLGGGDVVSNFFSVDPRTDRIWIAATAPDEADGTMDDVSEYGAIYGLDPVFNGAAYELVEACHRYFEAGSASTPALRADGERIYVGDGIGGLLAIDSECQDVWSYHVGDQLIGSVGVSSDNGELYVATNMDIYKIIDMGTYAVQGWRANLEAYDPGLGQSNTNLNLYAITANGVGFQAGAGYFVFGFALPLSTGVGLLDRETGQIRYFVDGLEETVGTIHMAPDGAILVGNSPVRRAISRSLFPDMTPPIVGGVSKFTPVRLDLLVRDAVCAAADRALNAHAVSGTCPDSAAADILQIHELIAQCRGGLTCAVAAGDLTQTEADNIEALLVSAETALSIGTLDSAAGHLANICTLFP